MKLYYWSPFFSNIATEKAVINSIYSIKKYSKETIKPYLLEVIGEWKNHLRHGQGTHKWANGSKYEGEWKNNKPNGIGKGVSIFPNGNKYLIIC